MSDTSIKSDLIEMGQYGVTSQYEAFAPQIERGTFPCVYVLSPCTHGFSLGAMVSTHNLKTC